MRRLLFFIVITAMGMGQGLSQSLIQTYTDRCTGQTQMFSVPMNGSTVVTFYNRSKTFTSQDFQNGTLRAWLEETYLWWTNLNPCSTASTGAVATQQTTQQTTQQATQAATNAAANTTTNVPNTTSSPPATSQTSQNTGTNTSATNTSGSTQDSSASGASTGSTGDNTSGSGTTESGSTESQSGSTEGGSSSTETSESSDTTEGTSESSSESKSEEKTEEVKEEKKEEPKEESKDEKSDESKEEDSEEKSDEEKSDDEESEDKEEEDSEEKEDNKDEEEDDEDKKKKRALAPPIISANMLTQQSPLGGYDTAASFGISQSSLLGDKTYGINAMVYSNGQQFMLTANYSQIHINDEGRVNRVYSGSIGGMKMFTTYMGMMNHSVVWLGKKGSATGFAFGTTLTSLEVNIERGSIFYDEIILGASLTGFWTRPIMYSPKLTVTPMIAISSPFASLGLFFGNGIEFNKDIMIIGGPSFTYRLTQRFGLNLGVTFVDSTIKGFPTMKTYTIGGRLSF